MKRMILSVVMVLTGLAFTAGVAAQPPGDPDAAEPGEQITGIVAFEGSFVYVGPDFAYDILATLPRNTSVEVLGRRGDFFFRWDGRQWLQVRWGGDTGWIYARLVRTSIPFNSIPPTGRPLPRDRNGRVPEVFDLSDNICDRWPDGPFSLSGDFRSGDETLTVTYPEMPGANVYSVITLSPTGFRTAFDSETTTAIIELDRLPAEPGVYTWRVAPYWTNATQRFRWQQICLLKTGGTFVRPAENTDAAMTGTNGSTSSGRADADTLSGR